MINYSTTIQALPNITALNLLQVPDKSFALTHGYTTRGVGGGIYQFLLGDTTAIDYGFVHSGLGGRWHLIDKSAINVTQWGCIGDGVSDDSIPFSRCLNASINGAPINLEKKSLKLASWTSNGYVVNGKTSIEDGSILGTSSTTSTVRFLTTNSGWNLKLQDVTFENWFAPIYQASGSGGSVNIESCIIRDCGRGLQCAQNGGLTPYNRTVNIANCLIENVDYWGIVWLDARGKISITDNHIRNVLGTTASAGGIYAGSSTGWALSNYSGGGINVRGNLVENITTSYSGGVLNVVGIICEGGIASITDNTVMNVRSSTGQYGDGIYAQCQDQTVSNNLVMNCSGPLGNGCITVKTLTPSGGTKITQNTIHNTYDVASQAGIFVQNQEALVANNVVLCTDSGTMNRGIYVIGCNHSLVQGNILSTIKAAAGYGVVGIEIHTADDTVVKDNIIYDLLNAEDANDIVGVYVRDACDRTTIAGNKLTRAKSNGNGSTSAGPQGIRLQPSNTANLITWTKITDNEIYGYDYGVYVPTTTPNVILDTIVKNNIIDRSTAVSAAEAAVYGMYFAAGINRIVIEDNFVGNIAGGANAAMGIRLVLSTTSTAYKNILVNRNTVKTLTSGGTSRAIEIAAAGSGVSVDNCTMNDNVAIDTPTAFHVSDVSLFSNSNFDRNNYLDPVATPVINYTGSPTISVHANDNRRDGLKRNNLLRVNLGNLGTTETFDWLNWQSYYGTLNSNCIFTFTAPDSATNMLLTLIQDGTGGWTVTFPTIQWMGGVVKQPNATSGASTTYNLYYDGIKYYELGTNSG